MYSRLQNQYEYEGNALGFSMCKRLIQKLNGSLEDKSEIGQGSILEIKLPNGFISKQELS